MTDIHLLFVLAAHLCYQSIPFQTKKNFENKRFYCIFEVQPKVEINTLNNIFLFEVKE